MEARQITMAIHQSDKSGKSEPQSVSSAPEQMSVTEIFSKLERGEIREEVAAEYLQALRDQHSIFSYLLKALSRQKALAANSAAEAR